MQDPIYDTGPYVTTHTHACDVSVVCLVFFFLRQLIISDGSIRTQTDSLYYPTFRAYNLYMPLLQHQLR
jgi:hypothetical protein